MRAMPIVVVEKDHSKENILLITFEALLPHNLFLQVKLGFQASLVDVHVKSDACCGKTQL